MKLFNFFAISLLPVLFFACSASITGPTDLGSIPDATGPVVSDGSSSVSGAQLQLASTGILASSLSGLTWNSTHSGPFCEIGSMTTRLISEAAQSDKIKCYMAAGADAGIFTPQFDGSAHYLTFTNAGGGTPKAKYIATKDGSGNLTSFKMFLCFQSSTQDEFVSSVLASSGTLTLTSVGSHSGGGFTGAQRTIASGTINSDGQWVGEKEITHKGSYSGTVSRVTFSGSQAISAVFTDEQITVQGYRTGSYGGDTHTGSIYAIIQLLFSPTASLENMYFGGGTAKAQFTYGASSKSATKAWNGDTRAPLSDATAGDFYSAVNAATLPSAETITISFSTDETWDCSVDAANSTEVDMGAFDSASGAAHAGKIACDAKYFSDHNQPSCHSASFD